jgi:hypothetical protein
MASRVLRGISRRDGSFGDIASDLVGKPIHVLVAENYALLSTALAKLYGLTCRKYVIDVGILCSPLISTSSFLNFILKGALFLLALMRHCWLLVSQLDRWFAQLLTLLSTSFWAW